MKIKNQVLEMYDYMISKQINNQVNDILVLQIVHDIISENITDEELRESIHNFIQLKVKEFGERDVNDS